MDCSMLIGFMFRFLIIRFLIAVATPYVVIIFFTFNILIGLIESLTSWALHQA
jgi:hypothetical protein